MDVVFFNNINIQFVLLKKKMFVKNHNKNNDKSSVYKSILYTHTICENIFVSLTQPTPINFKYF